MNYISTVMIFFCIYSFMGWIFEVIITFLLNKKFVNRGFLFGPFIPIYGVGALVVLIIYSKLRLYTENMVILILFATITVSIIELLTGITMEKIFNARWWDYSHMKFNFMGHVSLLFSSIWGLFAYLLIMYLHPIINYNISILKPIMKNFTVIIGLIYFSIDIIVSFAIVSDVKGIVSKHHSLEKLREYLINKPDKIFIFSKIFNAFPKLRFSIYPSLHLDLKHIIENTHVKVAKKMKKKK